MLKLYKLLPEGKEYWETWSDDDGNHTIHWGFLGTEGNVETYATLMPEKAKGQIQRAIDMKLLEGFRHLEVEGHKNLTIEYAAKGMGVSDVEKRYRLEQRLDELLGWSGLGHCDGGSIGNDTMDACCFVVDFDLAKRAIESGLADTEFANFLRIYDEDVQ